MRYAVNLTRRNPDHGDDPQQLEVLNQTVTMVTEDDVYVFTVINCLGNSDFIIEVGGVNKPVIVDFGASVNVIDRCMWEWLKGRGVKCVFR